MAHVRKIQIPCEAMEATKLSDETKKAAMYRPQKRNVHHEVKTRNDSRSRYDWSGNPPCLLDQLMHM